MNDLDHLSAPARRGTSVVAAAGRLGVLAVSCLLAVACNNGGGGGGTINNPGTGAGRNAQLAEVAAGRLVDVFGLRSESDGSVIVELYEEDVLVSTTIQDERGANEVIPDQDIRYDFLAASPDDLQPRLLITREIGSPEFEQLFDELDDDIPPLSASVFGQEEPFPIIPRNAGIRLTFTSALPVDDSFFYEFNENDQIVGVRNTEAVQLLRIVGDPTDQNPLGDFEVITARINVKRNQIIIDPVLLGTEGQQLGDRNNATGLPASPLPNDPSTRQAANIRIAVALDGPLAIPGLRPDASPAFTGRNNAGGEAIIRDFRSGNSGDENANLANGFIRDPERPRILGEMRVLVSNVDRNAGGDRMTVEIFKDSLRQRIDRGDVIRFLRSNAGGQVELLGSSEVLIDPVDDSAQRFVNVQVRFIEGLESIDPTNDPNRPGDLRSQQGQAWLRVNAPRAVLAADFTLGDVNDPNPATRGDDPRNFVTFSPTPLPRVDGSPSESNENISPFASAIVRFSKPVDLETVRPLDSFFIATKDLFDESEKESFIERYVASGRERIDNSESFNEAKYRTPHLVGARRTDEDGSQTAIRLEPLLGMYLDQEMRDRANDPTNPEELPYFVHLLGGEGGIRDLSGNTLDFQVQRNAQAADFVTIPFTLDTRVRQNGQPFFPDNRVVHVVRRFSDPDEDERPSYYIAREAAESASGFVGSEAVAQERLEDFFGAVTYLANGRLEARGTSRIRRICDDRNQQPPPPQESDLRWCIENDGGNNNGVASSTGGNRFASPIQNPLNPFGCRLQALWREIDLSLSRLAPDDFNLDVEQMYWGIFVGGEITFDEFDRTSLYLGHSEYRPEPCVGSFSSQGLLDRSGLFPDFEGNYVNNLAPVSGNVEERQDRFPAYEDKNLQINASIAIFEPNGINRFLPLPEFDDERYTWRDETLMLQGANAGGYSDVYGNTRRNEAYIVSPWNNGQGRHVRVDPNDPNQIEFIFGFWNNFAEFQLSSNNLPDNFTGGGVGSIALPLLADFWIYPDDPSLPEGNPFRATGFNGWQISIAVQSGPQPNFRMFSGGGIDASGNIQRREPGTPEWVRASGGYTPTGQRTVTGGGDNSVYWIMIDFLKSQSVATSGFVEILDPHRILAEDQTTTTTDDPRIGPYLFDDGTGALVKRLPNDVLPFYTWAFDPPLESLPAGTDIIPEFRGASRVDPQPWRFTSWVAGANQDIRGARGEGPDPDNFPLDPGKACDAHIRKFDDRTVNGASRNYWAYNYNRHVTDYTSDLNDLTVGSFLQDFVGPQETLTVQDIEYFNWRFILRNNVDAQVPVSPSMDSFMVAYRFDRQR